MLATKKLFAPIWALAIAGQILLLTLFVSCDNRHESIPETFDYAAYVQKFGKSYNEVETLARAKLFYARTLGIFKLNALYIKHKANHFLSQNEYTDMTPSEMKSSLVSKNIDLVPVREAGLSPNTPADQFENGVDMDDIQDGFSQAAATESTDETPSRKPTVNFFSDLEGQKVEPKEIVRELVENSDVAKKLSKVIETKPNRKAGKLKEEAAAYMKANGVEYKPNVEPENENYDPSLVPSFAWYDDVDHATDTFADTMMEDFLGNINFRPYPPPRIPSGRVLKDEDLPLRKESLFGEFMGSIKTFYDYFSKEDDAVIVNPNENELDKEEQQQAHDGAGKAAGDHETNKAVGDGKQLVFDIDWRRTGCISRPKSQSKCNSCYAFATIDLMEFFYCRQKKTATEFSAQYVIDCGSKSNLNGCQGGKLSHVGQFIQKYGLNLNAAYPYDGLEHQCPYDEDSDAEEKSWAMKPTISGWRMFPEMQAWYKWLPKSPIIVGINMPGDFLAYGGGVHDGADCTPGMVHAMLLVGSGKQDGKPFWLLKNTFAESWGDEGYFKLSKKAPIKCFNSAVVARANFKD